MILAIIGAIAALRCLWCLVPFHRSIFLVGHHLEPLSAAPGILNFHSSTIQNA